MSRNFNEWFSNLKRSISNYGYYVDFEKIWIFDPNNPWSWYIIMDRNLWATTWNIEDEGSYDFNGEGKKIRKEYEQFISTRTGNSIGQKILINSGYRSYKDQEDITNLYLNTYGQSYVDKFVAKPGFSEHQTGLAFDVGSKKKKVFAESNEYTWMKENAWKYGFIERFTKQYEPITGFRSEAWHYRYVGENIAKVIHNDPMAYEEYFAVYLDK